MNPPPLSQSPGDFDYSTDQSTRVSRRVAYGVYRLTHDGRDVGEEVWGIFALRSGGYRLMTEIDLQWPVPNQQRANLDVDARWMAQALWAQVEMNNTRRHAAYVPSGTTLDVQITEARVHSEDDHGGKNKLRSRALGPNSGAERPPSGHGKSVLRRELPFSVTTHLDFASALFNFVVLQRLGLLQPKSSATFDSVVLTLPTLEPLEIPQSYYCEGEEVLRSDPSELLTRRYTIAESGVPETMTTFWTDMQGIVIKQELTVGGAPHGCEMVSYRWQG